MGRIEYGPVSFHPRLPAVEKELLHPRIGSPVWQRMTTLHEGEVLYHKQWNFWVRAGAAADPRADHFFRGYEQGSTEIDALLRDAGFPWAKAETEEEIWGRIGAVWGFLRAHVVDDGAAYGTISSDPEGWPSIADYARHYAANGRLVWAACFSKAHLFATLLGRVVYPRFRFAIAEAHHAEGGAPPTATHVYVAAYVADRWFYLDPTVAPIIEFPGFADRRSLGVASFATVDYRHPYALIPVPLSGFTDVPFLPD